MVADPGIKQEDYHAANGTQVLDEKLQRHPGGHGVAVLWHGMPQVAACAGVGAVMETMTGSRTRAAGAYFNTKSRRETLGAFADASTK